MYTIENNQNEFYYGYTSIYGHVFKPNRENAQTMTKSYAERLANILGFRAVKTQPNKKTVMKTDALKWWESLDVKTKLSLMYRYCNHWKETTDVTDNDIDVMFEAEKENSPIKIYIETDEQYKDRVIQNQTVDIENLQTDNLKLETENQQLREVLREYYKLMDYSDLTEYEEELKARVETLLGF